MHILSQLPTWAQNVSDILAVLVALCTALSAIFKAFGWQKGVVVAAAIGVDIGKIKRHLPGANASFEAKQVPALTQQIEDTKAAVVAAQKDQS